MRHKTITQSEHTTLQYIMNHNNITQTRLSTLQYMIRPTTITQKSSRQMCEQAEENQGSPPPNALCFQNKCCTAHYQAKTAVLNTQCNGPDQGKVWRTMVHKNSYLAEVFTKPPLSAYRRQPNIGNYLIRAKVTKNEKKKRLIKT